MFKALTRPAKIVRYAHWTRNKLLAFAGGVMWLTLIMEERDSPIPIAIGVMIAFSWHLFGGDSIYSAILYFALLPVAVIFSTKINGRKPFKAAGYVTFGVIIGTIIDLILFPTINGFERNLGPIEIALAAIISTVVTCITGACVNLYWKLTNAT